jgi:hypothetical protein
MVLAQRLRWFLYSLGARLTSKGEVVRYREFPSPSPVLIRGEIRVGMLDQNVLQFPARALKQASG